MKKEDTKGGGGKAPAKPGAELMLHTAISQAPALIIENPTVIDTYNKINAKYGLAKVKTVEQAMDCGIWVVAAEFDPEKAEKEDVVVLKGKKQQAVVMETYLYGRYDHPLVRKATEDNGTLHGQSKRRCQWKPSKSKPSSKSCPKDLHLPYRFKISICGHPMKLRESRYYLVLNKETGKQAIITPKELIGKMEFSGCKTLAAARAEDKETADSLVQYMVAKMAKAFNIKHNITPPQIKETLDSLLVEYPFLKLSEIYYVLRGIKMGRYGKIYERLDESVIMTAFDVYINEERFKIVEERNYLKHDKITAAEKGRAYNGLFDKIVRDNEKWKQRQINEAAERKALRMVDNFLVNERKFEQDGGKS